MNFNLENKKLSRVIFYSLMENTMELWNIIDQAKLKIPSDCRQIKLGVYKFGNELKSLKLIDQLHKNHPQINKIYFQRCLITVNSNETKDTVDK